MTTPNSADSSQAGIQANSTKKNNILAVSTLTLGITGL